MHVALRSLLSILVFASVSYLAAMFITIFCLLSGACPDSELPVSVLGAATGLVAAVFFWRSFAGGRPGRLKSMALGSLIVGSIAFAIGFVGVAMVGWLLGYDPTMAPMWGFILGPLGFVLGAQLGAVWWRKGKGAATAG